MSIEIEAEGPFVLLKITTHALGGRSRIVARMNAEEARAMAEEIIRAASDTQTMEVELG